MDIICKPSYDVVFWRHTPNEDWAQASLSDVIEAYEDEPYCDFIYWTAVHPESDETKDLYHLWTCSECGVVSVSLDKEHDFEFCPHCGRAILFTEFETEVGKADEQ